jgi:murein DD-endopeptidase MepM/ murein hydrolase activator NlpD
MRIKSLLNPMLAVVVMGAFAPHATRAETPSHLAVAALDTSGATTAKPEPMNWLPSRGRECNERGRYKRFCAGPRRAPLPFGEEAELAKELGIGDRKTVSHLLLQTPKPEWIEAAGPVFNEDPIWPVPGGKFWRGFGREYAKKRRGKNHDGIDIGAPVGTPIVSVQDGIVVYADNDVRGYGNFLVTVHGDGTVAFYAHCKSIYVFPGQIVSQGQIVAEVGTTGYARGPHLHFEMRNKGRLKDPMKLLLVPQPDNS